MGDLLPEQKTFEVEDVLSKLTLSEKIDLLSGILIDSELRPTIE